MYQKKVDCAKLLNRHSSKSMQVIKLSFCQNDPPMGESAQHRSAMPKVNINSWTDSSISSVYSPFCFQVCGLLFWSFPYYSYFLAQIIPNHCYGLTGQPDHFHYHFHSFDVHVLVHLYAGCAQVYPERNLIDFRRFFWTY